MRGEIRTGHQQIDRSSAQNVGLPSSRNAAATALVQSTRRMGRARVLLVAACAAAALLAVICTVPAQGASLYQPGLGSVLKAMQSGGYNASQGAHSEQSGVLSTYSASAAAVSACLPLSVKFYDAQRSGQVQLPCLALLLSQ